MRSRFRALFTDVKDKWEDIDVIGDAKNLWEYSDVIGNAKELWEDRDLVTGKVKRFLGKRPNQQLTASYPTKSVSQKQGPPSQDTDRIGLSLMDDWDNFKDEKQQYSSNDPIPSSTSYQSKSISEIQGHPVEVGDQIVLHIMDVGSNLKDENVQHSSKDSTPPSTSYPSKVVSEIQGHPVEVGDRIGSSLMIDWDNFKDETQQYSSNEPIPPSTSYQSMSISEIQSHPIEVGDQIVLYIMDVGSNLKDESVHHSSNDSTPPSTSYPSKSVSEIQGHHVEVGEKLKGVKISKEGETANIKSDGAFLGELERNIPKRFSPEDLTKFTSSFADRVGCGGFGRVYRGKFLDGTEIAVKVLEENDFVEETFEVEVSTMFKTCHRYLVKCYGYCFDPAMKALVYEYMENGSLDALLYGNPRKLKWKTFYKIAINTAKGLSYLHDGCDNQIIHHDLKPANVLIDRHLSVKITDFGLARIMNNNVDHVTWSKQRGTPGYIAPEMYLPTAEITYKCDVYSFGMMLFEVLGMRRNGRGLDWFPKQVWSKFECGELDQIIDDCGIHKEKYRVRARVVSVVALWCVQFTPQTRPSMSTVVKMLEGEIQAPKPPNPFYPSPEWSYSRFSDSPPFDKKACMKRDMER